jgi:biopolymer transport protein ExbD
MILYPIAMPGAMRDDVMQVSITRDGKVFFGSDQIVPDYMAEKIQARLRDLDVERKVYIRAGARTRYGTVKTVLDGVRSAGIIRVAFLVDQRRGPILTQ